MAEEKIIVGRKMVYLEVFEVDMSKLASVRENLDLCKRILYSADPVLTQQLRSFTEEGKSAVKLLSRTQDHILENPVYPISDPYVGVNEAVAISNEG